MIVIIPMAGAGSRFTQAGYTLPKPLLTVRNKPMIVQAAKSLPKAERYAFILRKIHEEKYAIKEVLANTFPDTVFVEIDEVTQGQACTCLLAKEALDTNEEWLIGASDNGMIFQEEKWEKLKMQFDALVFTFRGNKAVTEKPEAYGWVVSNDKGEIQKVSVKKPISKEPLKDHAVVGAFWYKKGQYFVDSAEKMVLEEKKINGEFYVDESINNLIQMGKKVGVFEIEEYVGWGTPNDYETFQYWDSFFSLFSINAEQK